MSNIPLTVLTEVNNVELMKLNGERKKEIVLDRVRHIINDNVNMMKLIEELIELFVELSRKQLKLMINKNKCLPI